MPGEEREKGNGEEMKDCDCDYPAPNYSVNDRLSCEETGYNEHDDANG